MAQIAVLQPVHTFCINRAEMEQKLKFEKVSYTQFCADAQKNGIFLTPAEMVEAYEGMAIGIRKGGIGSTT